MAHLRPRLHFNVDRREYQSGRGELIAAGRQDHEQLFDRGSVTVPDSRPVPSLLGLGARRYGVDR